MPGNMLGEIFQNSHFLHHVFLFLKCSFIHPNLEMGSILPITFIFHSEFLKDRLSYLRASI